MWSYSDKHKLKSNPMTWFKVRNRKLLSAANPPRERLGKLTELGKAGAALSSGFGKSAY